VSKGKRKKTIIVTGGSGAIGTYVVRLALEAGFKVVVVGRSGTTFPSTDVEYERRVGDLTNRRFCQKAVEGGDIIIHTAAVNEPWRPYDELEHINVEAVRWLYEAAEDAGAERFVHLSTASLYKHKAGVIDEECDFEVGSNYTKTKEEAERFLRGRRDTGLAWTILRPSLVYGPMGRSFGAAILVIPPLLRLFTPLLPSLTGGPRTNCVHVEDVARAALFVAEQDGCKNEIFNVADDTSLSQGEILSAAIQAYGLDIGPTIPFPTAILANANRVINSTIVFRVLTNILTPLWKRIEERYDLTEDLQPKTDRALLYYLNGDKVIVSDKLKAQGWKPVWPDLREGLAETVKWYQEHRWVPDYKRIPPDDEHSVVSGIGLRYREMFSGSGDFNSNDAGTSLEMNITFATLKQLFMGRRANIEGRISIDGVADDCNLLGTLEIQATLWKVVYQFGFDGSDGESYRFSGEKKISVLHPFADFARMEGRIVGGRGEEVATITLEMDPGEGLRNTLLSIRLT